MPQHSLFRALLPVLIASALTGVLVRCTATEEAVQDHRQLLGSSAMVSPGDTLSHVFMPVDLCGYAVDPYEIHYEIHYLSSPKCKTLVVKPTRLTTGVYQATFLLNEETAEGSEYHLVWRVRLSENSEVEYFQGPKIQVQETDVQTGESLWEDVSFDECRGL